MIATPQTSDDDLVSRYGYASDWEIDGPITSEAIAAHIAGLEVAAEAEAAVGNIFSAGLFGLRAEAWRRRAAQEAMVRAR